MGISRPVAIVGGATALLCQSRIRSTPNTIGASVKGRGGGPSFTGKITIGATAATPSTSGSAFSCSPESRAPRIIPPGAPPLPAPLTVICPVAKSRPPLTRRSIFSASAPSNTRAATPMAMPAAVSALRTRRRPSSRTTARTAGMGGSLNRRVPGLQPLENSRRGDARAVQGNRRLGEVGWWSSRPWRARAADSGV